MKKNEFLKLKEFDYFDIDVDLEEGDCFLTGEHMINQKQNKNPSDQISYYKVFKKRENNIEYGEVFDILESEKKEEDKNGSNRIVSN